MHSAPCAFCVSACSRAYCVVYFYIIDCIRPLNTISSAQVHYRHAITHKWSLLAVTSANSDAFSEHLLDLSPHFNAKEGLFTQYLRLKPLGHHVRPCMRVAVYGVDPRAVARGKEEWREGMYMFGSGVYLSHYCVGNRIV